MFRPLGTSGPVLNGYEQEKMIMELTWTTSASADEDNHDQETDLDSTGSPGGAAWATVAPEGGPDHKPWMWVIYDRWIDVDEHDSELAAGETDHEDEAKAAVAAWVSLENIRASLRAENISYGELIELASLVPYIAPGDTELLEPAGVPEFSDQSDTTNRSN
jgi:hypothetical protein